MGTACAGLRGDCWSKGVSPGQCYLPQDSEAVGKQKPGRGNSARFMGKAQLEPLAPSERPSGERRVEEKRMEGSTHCRAVLGTGIAQLSGSVQWVPKRTQRSPCCQGSLQPWRLHTMPALPVSFPTSTCVSAAGMQLQARC